MTDASGRPLAALHADDVFRITALAHRREATRHDDRDLAPYPRSDEQHAAERTWHGANRELMAALTALDEDAQIELIALMWLGRGDGAGWPQLLEDARRMSDIGNAHYIAGKLALATYLENGWRLITAGEH